MRDLKWKKVKEEHIVQDQWIDFRRCRYQFPNGEEFEPYYNYSRRSYSVIVARDENGDYDYESINALDLKLLNCCSLLED